MGEELYGAGSWKGAPGCCGCDQESFCLPQVALSAWLMCPFLSHISGRPCWFLSQVVEGLAGQPGTALIRGGRVWQDSRLLGPRELGPEACGVPSRDPAHAHTTLALACEGQ